MARVPGKKAREQAAMQARARMAKRGRRNRWIKENKQRLTVALLLFMILLFVAFFTPYGPNYYRQKIEQRMFSAPGVVAPGILRDLHKLARFYSWTFRKDKAIDTYDEIGQLYYGFTFTGFSISPGDALEKRFEGDRLKAKGESYGPPYEISSGDLPFVGTAIYNTGELMIGDRPKQFIARLFNELYLDDFFKEHPDACNPEITKLVEAAGKRVSNRSS